jgi:hypothetical protein
MEQEHIFETSYHFEYTNTVIVEFRDFVNHKLIAEEMCIKSRRAKKNK